MSITSSVATSITGASSSEPALAVTAVGAGSKALSLTAPLASDTVLTVNGNTQLQATEIAGALSYNPPGGTLNLPFQSLTVLQVLKGLRTVGSLTVTGSLSVDSGNVLVDSGNLYIEGRATLKAQGGTALSVSAYGTYIYPIGSASTLLGNLTARNILINGLSYGRPLYCRDGYLVTI